MRDEYYCKEGGPTWWLLNDFIKTCYKVKLLSPKEYHAYWQVVPDSFISGENEGFTRWDCYTHRIKLEIDRVLKERTHNAKT